MFIRVLALFVCLPLAIEAQNQPDPAQSPVVLVVPGMDQARIERNVAYTSTPTGSLMFDAYAPSTRNTGGAPAIVFVSGGEDVRSWKWFESYGRLAAAKGMVGIVPAKRYPRGFPGIQSGHADTDSLLSFLQRNGARHGIDPDRICVWSFSAGGRLMSVPLSANQSVRCVVGFYTISDLTAEFAGVADSTQRVGLLEKYSPAHVLRARGAAAPPVFIARAGQDGAVINNSISRFLEAASAANAAVTYVNYPQGVHGFDAFNDTDESRRIIEQAFEFVAHNTRKVAGR